MQLGGLRILPFPTALSAFPYAGLKLLLPFAGFRRTRPSWLPGGQKFSESLFQRLLLRVRVVPLRPTSMHVVPHLLQQVSAHYERLTRIFCAKWLGRCRR